MSRSSEVRAVDDTIVKFGNGAQSVAVLVSVTWQRQCTDRQIQKFKLTLFVKKHILHDR